LSGGKRETRGKYVRKKRAGEKSASRREGVKSKKRRFVRNKNIKVGRGTLKEEWQLKNGGWFPGLGL